MYYVKECVKDLERIGGRQGRADYLRLDMNENPEGLPVEFVEKVKSFMTPEFFATYPEPCRFASMLADFLGVKAENLCLTNGSDLGIRYLYEVFARPNSTVVTVTPVFEMYRIWSRVFGLTHKTVPYHEDFTVDADEFVQAIDENTSIVAVLNPGSPIGTVCTEEELDRIIQKAQSVGAIVIIDEAYHYFYHKTFLNKVFEYDNVAVLRTFSKLFSLAGCRMGFVISNEKMISYLHHVRPTFEVNSVALLFGEMILKEPGLLDRLITTEREGREYLLASLRKHGYSIFSENGNYAFIRPKTSAKQVEEKLEKAHILIKTYYSNPLLKDYIRICTGSVPVMDRFLSAFYEADKESL